MKYKKLILGLVSLISGTFIVSCGRNKVKAVDRHVYTIVSGPDSPQIAKMSSLFLEKLKAEKFSYDGGRISLSIEHPLHQDLNNIAYLHFVKEEQRINIQLKYNVLYLSEISPLQVELIEEVKDDIFELFEESKDQILGSSKPS